MKPFFSNSIDVLADSLRDILFCAGLHPLSARTVIVPSAQVKHSLQMRWAHDPKLKVVCAVRFLEMPHALAEFFPGLPSKLELSLKIENCLLTIDDPQLQQFLEGIGQERYLSFCDHLSELFLRYFAYDGKVEGWQQQLWEKVWPQVAERKSDDHLFLFYPPFLPPRFRDFFQREAAALFALSPSQHYWGDVLAPKEQLFLPHLEEYFEAQHPLLTHFGKAGREFEKSISAEGVSRYAAPKKKSLLSQIQKSLLDLSPLPRETQEGIEIHAARSKRREVEIVLERISQLKVPLSEIVVLAPDMAEYAPYIHMVFAGRCDYAIYDLPLDADSSVAPGVRALLHIVEHRLAPSSVKSLLSCTPFLQKFSLDAADVEKIQKWSDEVRLPWNSFFARALTAILAAPESDDPSLDMEDLELLAKWREVTGLLEKFLTPLIENQTKMVAEWMVFLQEMVSTLFVVDQEDEPLMRYLRAAAKIEAGLFSWTSVRRAVEDMIHRKFGVFQASHLNAVRFASLCPVMATSVIIVMGMEEGKFPRKEKNSSLALADEKYRPSHSELDRYLFLQLLLTAKDKLIFTYTCIDVDDGKEVPPSIVLAELCKMLPQVKITKHSPRPYPAKMAKRELPETAPSHTIDVRHLRLLARHPIEFYLQRSLGLYFDSSSSSFVSHYDLAQARRSSLKQSAPEIVHRMQTKGKLPFPPFQEMCTRKVTEEIEDFQKMLRMWGVNEIFSVDMRAGCDAAVQKSETEWIVPALKISDITIVGKINDLTSKGLLFSGGLTYPDLLKAWPLLLLLHHLPLEVPRQLLLTRDGAQKAALFPDPAASLKRYLSYYMQAMQKPSPFLPRIAKNILSGEEIKIEDDPIVDWFLDHFEWPDVKQWQPFLREVFDAEI